MQKIKLAIRNVYEVERNGYPGFALRNLVLRDTQNSITPLVHRKLEPRTVLGLVAQIRVRRGAMPWFRGLVAALSPRRPSFQAG